MHVDDVTISTLNIVVAILKSVDIETQKKISSVLSERIDYFQSLAHGSASAKGKIGDIQGRPFDPDNVSKLLVDAFGQVVRDDPSNSESHRPPNTFGF